MYHLTLLKIWNQLHQSATVFGNTTAANSTAHNDIIGGGEAGGGRRGGGRRGTHARVWRPRSRPRDSAAHRRVGWFLLRALFLETTSEGQMRSKRRVCSCIPDPRTAEDSSVKVSELLFKRFDKRDEKIDQLCNVCNHAST